MTKELVAVQSVYGWGIKYNGGGQLPTSLKGLYTSKGYAENAIKLYLATRRKRKPTNGTSKTESGA